MKRMGFEMAARSANLMLLFGVLSTNALYGKPFAETLNEAAAKGELEKLAEQSTVRQSIFDELKKNRKNSSDFNQLLYIHLQKAGKAGIPLAKEALKSKDPETAVAAVLATVQLSVDDQREVLEPVVLDKNRAGELRLEAATILSLSKNVVAKKALYEMAIDKRSFLLLNKSKLANGLAAYGDAQGLETLLGKNISRWNRKIMTEALMNVYGRMNEGDPRLFAEKMREFTGSSFDDIGRQAFSVLSYRYRNPKSPQEREAIQATLEKISEDPLSKFSSGARGLLAR